MKKPATIDQDIEFTVYSHAMSTPPHRVEVFDPEDISEKIYAKAMALITDGNVEEGQKYLWAAYSEDNW